MTNPNMSQFLEIFLDEGRDQIVLLEKSFMALEGGGGSQELLQDVFRAAHTLKGDLRIFGARDWNTPEGRRLVQSLMGAS